MDINVQELRELLEKATPGPWIWKQIGSYSTPGVALFWSDTSKGGVHYRRLDANGGMTEADADLITNAVRALPALLAENDALRAELQARQWQPIETCPRKHGKHYLICKDCGPGSLPSISIGFCFDDQKDWHLMDSNCTAEMYGYRVTHWHPLPLPPAPPQGDGA